jgi:hypothetical protein
MQIGEHPGTERPTLVLNPTGTVSTFDGMEVGGQPTGLPGTDTGELYEQELMKKYS